MIFDELQVFCSSVNLSFGDAVFLQNSQVE